MSAKVIAFSFVALLGAATAYADPASPALRIPGKWRHETRQVGPKTTAEVYKREPYSLTGDVEESKKKEPVGPWKHQRRMGPKGPIDVYTR